MCDLHSLCNSSITLLNAAMTSELCILHIILVVILVQYMFDQSAGTFAPPAVKETDFCMWKDRAPFEKIKQNYYCGSSTLITIPLSHPSML